MLVAVNDTVDLLELLDVVGDMPMFAGQAAPCICDILTGPFLVGELDKC